MHSKAIRYNAFNGTSQMRQQRVLAELRNSLAPINIQRWFYGGVCTCLVLMSGAGWWGMENEGTGADTRALAPSVVTPMVRNDEWRSLDISAKQPDILSKVEGGLRVQSSAMLPVFKLDGAEINGRLPKAIWLKFEQPGNAFLIIETDCGTFVKVLEDATPGFASRCKLDPESFGTLDGKAAEVDASDLTIKTMWVIQDASAEKNRIPGWLTLNAPDS